MPLALLQENVDLAARNTLAVPAVARWLAEFTDPEQLPELCAWAQQRDIAVQILGAGSNVVLAADWPGLVICPANKGVDIAVEGEHRRVRIAAGENWDETVWRLLAAGCYGLENLVSIPGNVGAAPVQNIGAYGVELSDSLHQLEAFDRQTQRMVTLTSRDCEFAYRHSLFKKPGAERFIITSVELALSGRANLKLDFPALHDFFADRPAPTAQAVAQAVRRIRAAKLPDPADIPNAGSFFKNPQLTGEPAAVFRAAVPDCPVWQRGDTLKLSAAWLIDQAGWKQQQGPVQVHRDHALVLTNPGRCDGSSVLALASAIQDSVWCQFGVALEIEPRIIR